MCDAIANRQKPTLPIATVKQNDKETFKNLRTRAINGTIFAQRGGQTQKEKIILTKMQYAKKRRKNLKLYGRKVLVELTGLEFTKS